MSSQAVEYVPFVIELRLMPVLEPETREARGVRSFAARTWASPVTNIASAFANSLRLRDEYLRGSSRRRGRSLEELVQLSQGFAEDPEVAAAMGNAGIRQSQARRRRGRPRGMTAETREAGAGVYYFVRDAVTRGSTIDEALVALAERRFERLGYDRLKGLYYQMHRIMRPDPLMFTGAAARARLIERPDVHTIWQADSDVIP